MPDSAANSNSANGPFETPELPGGGSPPPTAAPLANHHGSAIADPTHAATLPPLTPATTTRQSVALGVLSTLWGNGSQPAIDPHDPSLPAITAHPPSSGAQEPASDLTTSTGSVPSTTTTLTNTLPPTQSAALRALNAPAFQAHPSSSTKNQPAKSTSSRTTLSSQPVVVRTYSGSRHASRPSSGVNSPRHYPNMNGHASSNPSALSAGLEGRRERLPSIEEFSFSAVLRAVDPEIREAIDAIAEICARSRMSLADEYDAHLPPQGEITSSGSGWTSNMGRGRVSRNVQAWSATENTLTAVPEASSSSERLAGEGRGSVTGSSKKRSQSAYGSLKSVISGGSGKRRAIEDSAEPNSPRQARYRASKGPAWSVDTTATSSNHPAITITTSPQASNQLSLDTSSTITDIPNEPVDTNKSTTQTAFSTRTSSHRRDISVTSLPPPSRTRYNALSSIASWLPWPRTSDLDSNTQQELTKAETRLREMLSHAQNGQGKGKAPVIVA